MIKMINGTYGWSDGKTVIPKTPADEPFTCDKAEEKRLVSLGVAEYVKTPAQLKAEAEALAKAEAEAKKAEEKAAQEAEKQAKAKAREEAIAKYKELKIGGNPNTMKIEDILAAIAKAEAEDTKADENGTDEDIVETDEDAPTFDEVDGVEG